MATVAGFPFFPLEFTKQGEAHDSAQVAALQAAVAATATPKVTELLVLAHGWNNDMAEARALYAELLGNLDRLLARGGARPSVAVVGTLWPSKRFADEDLIPAAGGGGTASTDDGELPTRALVAELERLKGTFDRPDADALERAKALAGRLDDGAAAREFVDLLRSLLPSPTDPDGDGAGGFLAEPGDELLERLRAPIRLRAASEGGTAAFDDGDGGGGTGGPAGFGDLFAGVTAGAWKLLNYTTYFQMKERAGVVGGGLNAFLAPIRSTRPDLRLHLVGHSFGARLVTAASDGGAALAPASLVLLQGAFSHNGFAKAFDAQGRDGFFRRVIEGRKVAGPILATHTANDRAVGVAYAIASRISGDNRAAFGDADDLFGGIGRNGAVRMGSGEALAMTLGAESATYVLQPGIVHNLRADEHIDSHSAVTNPAVANLLAAVLRS